MLDGGDSPMWDISQRTVPVCGVLMGALTGRLNTAKGRKGRSMTVSQRR